VGGDVYRNKYFFVIEDIHSFDEVGCTSPDFPTKEREIRVLHE
jgi:hypothetical protein